jgi:hypothetical protein
MQPYTAPTTYTNEGAALVREIGAATHISLDRKSAPTLGRWAQNWREEWGVTEGERGVRPVGWVTVNTRKRGPVVVWACGWTQERGQYVATIQWVDASYTSMTDAMLDGAKESAIEDEQYQRRQIGQRIGTAARVRYANATQTISRITDEQHRRLLARLLQPEAVR